MRRNKRNIWEWLEESTEGPSVTLSLPREVAEQLLSMLGAALEVDDMEGGGDDELGFDAGPPGGDDIDIPFGDIDDSNPSELDFGADDDMMPAGDDDDEPAGPPVPKKKSPPKDGGEKKADDKPKKKDDAGDKEKDKKESVSESVRRLGAYIPRGRR